MFPGPGGIDNVYGPAGRTHDPTPAARRSRSPGPGATKPLGPSQEHGTREPARSSPAPREALPANGPRQRFRKPAAAPATYVLRLPQPARDGLGNPQPYNPRGAAPGEPGARNPALAPGTQAVTSIMRYPFFDAYLRAAIPWDTSHATSESAPRLRWTTRYAAPP